MMKKKIISLTLAVLLSISMIIPSIAYAENSNEKQDSNVAEEVLTQEADSVRQKESESVTQEVDAATQKENKPVTREAASVSQKENEPATQDEKATVTQGKTIYVDGNSVGIGNDKNDGETKATPVNTLKKAVELAGENGEIIVLNPVSITEDIVLGNNVTIRRGGACSSGMIRLVGGSLTINQATIDGNMDGSLKDYPTSGGSLIVIQNAPKLTINEGARLCNQKGFVIDQQEVAAAVVTMNGGEICNNDASGTYYHAVIYFTQSEGSFYLKGGSIHDNLGAALDICAKNFEMTGGEIYNNNNTGQDAGGIHYSGDEGHSVTISGGEIYNNTANYGGGIYVAGRGTLTLKDDAVIRDNTARYYGGGVYVTLSNFNMEGGTISGNIGGYYGGAICIHTTRKEGMKPKVYISGGLIEKNKDEDGYTSGIGLLEEKDNATGIYYGAPKLELSGSPTIKDYIYLDDAHNMESKVDIVDTFTPTEPVPISDRYWTDGRVIVSYKTPLKPDVNHFVKYNKKKSQGIRAVDQDLQSVILPSYDVVFKEEDGSKTYDTISIEQDEKIPAEQAPSPVKAGYVLAGWRTANGNWDFDNDVVTGNMELYPIWKLEAPAFNLAADKDHLHEGDEQSATLVAQISIVDGEVLTYNWKWYKDGNVVKEGKNENVLNVTEAGVYKVELTVTNGTESSNPISKEITITKTNHVSSGDWQHDSKDHWKVCDECDKNIQQSVHTFGDWSDVSRAKRERVCTVCGYKVTEDTPDTRKYSVSYKFVSGTKGKDLPQLVVDLLPGDDTEYDAGTKVTAKLPTQTSVKVSDGTWTFAGYDANENVIIEDVTFTGTWTFEKKAKEYNISYKFVSGTKEKDLPKEVVALLPEDTAKYEEGTKVTVKLPEQTEVKTTKGKWVFNGYDADEKTVSDNTVFTGVWNFVEDGSNNNPPVIVVKDVTITLGSSFDAKSLARAVDVEDGDITDKIEVIKDTVDPSKEGSYEVTYRVTDSHGATTLSTITVNVVRASDTTPEKPDHGNQDKADQYKPTKPDTSAKDSSNSIKTTTVYTSSKSAQTGDHTPIATYGVIAGICAMGIIVFVGRKRKEQKAN